MQVYDVKSKRSSTTYFFPYPINCQNGIRDVVSQKQKEHHLFLPISNQLPKWNKRCCFISRFNSIFYVLSIQRPTKIWHFKFEVFSLSWSRGAIQPCRCKISRCEPRIQIWRHSVMSILFACFFSAFGSSSQSPKTPSSLLTPFRLIQL